MTILFLLAPLTLLMAAVSLVAFFWTFKAGQYDDPKGDAARILCDHLDEGPPSAGLAEEKAKEI